MNNQDVAFCRGILKQAAVRGLTKQAIFPIFGLAGGLVAPILANIAMRSAAQRLAAGNTIRTVFSKNAVPVPARLKTIVSQRDRALAAKGNWAKRIQNFAKDYLHRPYADEGVNMTQQISDSVGMVGASVAGGVAGGVIDDRLSRRFN